MKDTIYRADAIEAVRNVMCNKIGSWYDLAVFAIEALSALPSAETEPTVIRSRTFIPTKDFKEWAKRIREINPNAVVIPCDAEVVSAESVQGDGKMITIELKKRYPHSRDEDITDAFMRGYQAHADAVKGWIPCSERLPSESGTYLTTTAKGSVCTDHYYANSTDVSGRHWSYRSRREPIAWMPLPKPYKGGDDE